MKKDQFCGNCGFYDDSSTEENGKGICRRDPPKIIPMPAQGSLVGSMKLVLRSCYPAVSAEDRGCGGHGDKPNEN